MSKKIVFFQIGPGIGPITKNNFRFAEQLVKSGCEVILLGSDIDQALYGVMPDFIRPYSLESPSLIRSIPRLIRFMREERPDVVLASGPPTHILSAIGKVCAASRCRLVFRIHSQTTLWLKERSRWKAAVMLCGMSAARFFAYMLVSPSRGSADDWADLLHIRRDKVTIMLNPAVGDDVLEVATVSDEAVVHPFLDSARSVPTAIIVARLCHQKNVDVAIRAVARINTKLRLNLLILGDGPERRDLELLVDELGAKAFVCFVGWVPNPHAFVAKADVSLLTSRYEGFANVVAESLAVGTPVVSTDAPSGPAEILGFGEFGYLAPVGDVEAVSDQLIRALTDSIDRPKLKKRGLRYHVDNVVQENRKVFGLE